MLAGLILLFTYTTLFANDSTKVKPQHFVSFNTVDGFVFPTNESVQGEYSIPHYTSFSLKYGLASKGDKWEDYAYGLPYVGVGFYMAEFYRHDDLGQPFSIYLFQGGRLRQFTDRFSLNYEVNLGNSFNWKHYDPFDNPYNLALGSTVNVHVAASAYLQWKFAKKFDFNAGLSLTHFSNGATTLPNSGLNMASVFVELSYHFNREEYLPKFDATLVPPAFKQHYQHDLSFLISSRHAEVDTLGTGLASEFTGRKFKVLGGSYAFLFANNYRYKWGPSTEFVYDESVGITSWRELHPESGKTLDRVKLGSLRERFSWGLSIKGEIVQPHYSVFANIGYDFIHSHQKESRIYQILGVKLYLQNNLFGTFGIRATDLCRAQYLYWNLGYTFTTKKRQKSL
ncbi:MAG: acyloxyacyl hydrolase [Bacteroides sp.]|nr:acyloxyacyl hydrolase [Bacteroides sp.]